MIRALRPHVYMIMFIHSLLDPWLDGAASLTSRNEFTAHERFGKLSYFEHLTFRTASYTFCHAFSRMKALTSQNLSFASRFNFFSNFIPLGNDLLYLGRTKDSPGVASFHAGIIAL